MTSAIRIHKNGPPSVMKWEEVEIGKPLKGEVRLRQTAVGLNFIDTYFRAGLYPQPLPLTLGSEGAGVADMLFAGVDGEPAFEFQGRLPTAWPARLGATSSCT